MKVLKNFGIQIVEAKNLKDLQPMLILVNWAGGGGNK
jgi:hypothetical protein